MFESWGDHYFPDPGKVNEADCGVCGTRMEVVRNIEGATSWIMAMGRSKRKHDSFFCPHFAESWHKQLNKLWVAHKDTPSNKLKKLYEDEIEEILQQRKLT